MSYIPGDLVILKEAPPALLHGLPQEDQDAIKAMVGKQVTFVDEANGQAELEFTDAAGDTHSIWVDVDFDIIGIVPE